MLAFSDWLLAIDQTVFRWLNISVSNPLLDWAMPFFSWNPFFVPLLLLTGLVLLWKGGARGRLFLVILLLTVLLGDTLLCKTLKEALGRPRPFQDILEAHVLVGRSQSFGMPSSHAANWFAIVGVVTVFYRRALWVVLPLALLVSFSRIYNGVHYPGDVLAGAVVGIASSIAVVGGLQLLWTAIGSRWFPLWWAKYPLLIQPLVVLTRRDESAANIGSDKCGALTRRRYKTLGTPVDQKVNDIDNALEHQNPLPVESTGIESHWLRLGYAIIIVIFLARLAYLASGEIELSEDEAYQWTWSKHLALSYYSKPPLIAYTQFLGTTLWGDTAFGVRFFSPVIAAILSVILLRFLTANGHIRAGLWIVIITTATPLLVVGATLMTIDPLSVLFWTAAMVAGWNALQRPTLGRWMLMGLWMGLGFLSKYTALLQLVCWALFFIMWPPARPHLRRPGPYVALGVTCLCMLPVLIWNSQHQWITVSHVASDGALHQPWRPTLRYFWDFLFSEAGLLNPVFFGAAAWAAVTFWRRSWDQKDRNLLVYLFCMGAPVFLFYGLYTFHSRVLPNWIAPSIVPLFCLMAVYFDCRWSERPAAFKRLLNIGLSLGWIAVILLHDTDLVTRIAGRPLPPRKDPLRRVRAWQTTAEVVGEARQQLLREGKPVFIIGDHYGITGQLSFYMPEAKAAVTRQPLVYYRSSDQPDNQYYFWPGYQQRKGENALYLQQTDQPAPAPERLKREFASVKDIGMRDIIYKGRVFRRLQLFECRDLQ